MQGIGRKMRLELDENAIKNLEKLSVLYRQRKMFPKHDIASDNSYKEVALNAALCVLDLYEEAVEKSGDLPDFNNMM